MPSKQDTAPVRIYYVHPPLVGSAERRDALLDRVRDLGFDAVLVSPALGRASDGQAFRASDGDDAAAAAEIVHWAEASRARGLRLMLDVVLHRFAADHPLVARRPDCFAIRRTSSDAVIDPRRPDRSANVAGTALARLKDAECGGIVAEWAAERLRALVEAGVSGFRVLQPDVAEPSFWRDLIAGAKAAHPELIFIADSQGLTREAALELTGCGFDFLISSLAWWDGRESWFVEEAEAFQPRAKLIAPVESPFGPRLARRVGDSDALRPAYERVVALAAATGAGLLVPIGFEYAARRPLDPGQGAPEDLEQAARDATLDLSDAIRTANGLSESTLRFSGEVRSLTGPGAPVTVLLRGDAPDIRASQAALLVLINPDLDREAPVDPSTFLPSAGAEFGEFTPLDGAAEPFSLLRPGQVRLVEARRVKPITVKPAADAKGATKAAQQPRIAIEAVSPAVDGGAFPVKRVVGEMVTVEADVITDGHEQLAVELQWRALDEKTWRCAPMAVLGNDRWRGEFPLERLGRYEFTVESWLDVWGGFVRDLTKKVAANVDIALDLREGIAMVDAAQTRSSGDLAKRLGAFMKEFEKAPAEERASILLRPELREAMAQADERRFRVRHEPAPIVDAERLAARFASWYELFPRSQTDDPNRHGTFDDVIKRLPAVRDMGFDVLYFPPIHPIGLKNRKGRNNSLTAKPGEPGSPYAIGSEAGGHDAVHPELGTLEDFRRLVKAAREHGLEIALDFAIQCSPDHPWLKEHPGWFAWRPDGSLKYAENPPKKYEDIVNVDFYAEDAIPDLWIALKDVILHWAREGVRTFRVDNPHTKPLPFWEWMIRETRATNPDLIFLAEAFTRPKVMYRLAKLGFSQSYTYFTWRHTKAELTEYLTELTTTAPKDFFRPHFFVNTPDINPHFLQTSGRPGFQIRAALAATLSGLWGVYSGFELCESEPIPGKEEYWNSEKYEVKPRDWQQPGNIIPDITRLNRIRKSHPALQSHLGVTFYTAFNDNILYYGKRAPGARDMILVAVSLDPHHAQSADFEIPLWEWGLPDHGALQVEDLLREERFTWRGKRQWMRLDLDRPYAIWRVEPAAE